MPNTQDIVAVLNADLIVNKLGGENVAIVYFQDDWGLFVKDATAAEVEKLGSKVVLSEAMTPQARDFRSLITKIRSVDPDVIFLASHYQPSSIFMKQLRQAGIDTPVGGADTLYNPEFVALAGEAAEGVIATTYYFPGDPTKAGFTKSYTEMFGRGPDQWAAFAYDAIAITAEAARTVLASGNELTREALRDALEGLEPFSGATGVTKFFEGTPKKEMTLLVVKDGNYELN
jgi:branched-chain amino acid transport system substrate-binding protein